MVKKSAKLVCDSTSVLSDEFVGKCTILTDDAGKFIVRQNATCADMINKNNRVYPRALLQKAVDAVRVWINNGAIISELDHPEVVRTSTKEERFVNNHKRSTARVIAISDVGPDGWVTIDREILDTEKGREVRNAILSGKPIGISSRLSMEGQRKQFQGKLVDVALDLELLGFDDVRNPAFSDAGSKYQLLTDSELEELSSSPDANQIDSVVSKTDNLPTLVSDLVTYDPSDTQNTDSPPDTCKESEEDGKVNVADSKSAPTRKAPQMNLKTLVKKFTDAQMGDDKQKAYGDAVEGFCSAVVLKADKSVVAPALQEFINVVSDAELAGFVPGRPLPRAVMGYATGTEVASEGYQIEDAKEKSAQNMAAGADSANDAFITLMRQSYEADQAKKANDEKLQVAFDSQEEKIAKLPQEARDHVRDLMKTATDATQVPALVDKAIIAFSKVMADATLNSKGIPKGNTVDDPAMPGRVEVKNENAPWKEGRDKLLLAADAEYRSNSMFDVSPDASDVLSRRKENRKFLEKLSDKVVEGVIQQRGSTGGLAVLADCASKLTADAVTTTSTFLNQPDIIAFIIIQAFQDLKALQFVNAMGQGVNDGKVDWDLNNHGKLVKIMVEYFQDASSQHLARNHSTRMAYAENAGIDAMGVLNNWLTYRTYWRKGAIGLTPEHITDIGKGPLNLDSVARHLMHLNWAVSRYIDKDLLDEMINTSDEYTAVAVTSEAMTTGNSLLPSLSVYAASGGVRINLNPAKTAANGSTNGLAVIDAADKGITYPNAIGAIKLKGRGNGTSAPYTAITGQYITDPIVRPRNSYSNASSGAISTTVLNPFTVTLPANAVLGYLDDNNNVTDIGDGTTATYAVDWENGVLVFLTGVTGSSGVITTATTVTYSYGVNHDSFVLNYDMASANSLLVTGETKADYLNRMFNRISQTAASMGGAGRYVKPDLAINSLAVAAELESAGIFYKLNSPDGTNLFPTEDYYATRNGVNMARINSPWLSGDSRILLTRKGSTQWGVQQALEVAGQIYVGDSSGRVVDRQNWIARQSEIIATPQVTNQAGTVLNPVSRSIRVVL